MLIGFFQQYIVYVNFEHGVIYHFYTEHDKFKYASKGVKYDLQMFRVSIEWSTISTIIREFAYYCQGNLCSKVHDLYQLDMLCTFYLSTIHYINSK